ncbi:MAG: hypothetical protein ACJAVI_006204 [Candidatus Azotimanducaceae bacterium]|jgi:hypothetical protein
MSAPELKTQWLASLTGDIDQPTPVGEGLLIFNVGGAELKGPRVHATVIQPSGDWIRIQSNGNWKLDVRLLLATEAGDIIYCYYTGLLKGSPELSERIARGESIPGDEMYFRSTPYFETAAPDYLWLNDIVCVGSIREFGGGKAVYDLYEVL